MGLENGFKKLEKRDYDISKNIHPLFVEVKGDQIYFYILIIYSGIMQFILQLHKIPEIVAKAKYTKEEGYEPNWEYYYEIARSIRTTQYQIKVSSKYCQSIWYIHGKRQKKSFDEIMRLILEEKILDE